MVAIDLAIFEIALRVLIDTHFVKASDEWLGLSHVNQDAQLLALGTLHTLLSIFHML